MACQDQVIVRAIIAIWNWYNTQLIQLNLIHNTIGFAPHDVFESSAIFWPFGVVLMHKNVVVVLVWTMGDSTCVLIILWERRIYCNSVCPRDTTYHYMLGWYICKSCISRSSVPIKPSWPPPNVAVKTDMYPSKATLFQQWRSHLR